MKTIRIPAPHRLLPESQMGSSQRLWAVSAAFALLIIIDPAAPRAQEPDLLPFEADETLEEIRYQIDHNGYQFTVDHNWVFDLPPEARERLHGRHASLYPEPKGAPDAIGPLAGHLGRVALPPAFDWRDYQGHSYIGPIRNQFECGSCYAFAALAAAEGTYNFATGRYDSACADFSESYLIWCLARLPEYNSHFYGCNGASDYDYYELKALTVQGVGSDSDFPYQTDDPGACTHWSDATAVFASWHRIPCLDIDAIKTAIRVYGVVDAAVVTGDAFDAYSGGIYQDTYYGCVGWPEGAPCYYAWTEHAISLVGWVDDTDIPHWLLRNSFGSGWGEGGYMRIAYDSAHVSCDAAYLVYREASPHHTDFNGDGSSDIALFRPSTGLWAVRDLTRLHFGSTGDRPVPADYDGDRTTEVAIHRAGGLWAVRGLTRFFFGAAQDDIIPGDYDGDGSADFAVFSPGSALWSVRNVTGVYFGQSDDLPAPGWYALGDPFDMAVFRPASSLWSVRNLTLCYFGSAPDRPVPGDYANWGKWEAGVFRESSGLWAIRNVTRIYLGSSGDWALPADYNGDGADHAAIFRDSVSLWSVRNVTRVYFGDSGDIPVTR